MNLLGAICGSLLEYNSMYFGFRALYGMAMGCYLLAFLSEFAFKNRKVATSGQDGDFVEIAEVMTAAFLHPLQVGLQGRARI